MSKVSYVLMKEGWDYNDEIRFQPECGGGSPQKVFSDETKARTECDARNVEELKSLFSSGEIVEYSYGFDDLIPYRSRKDPEHREKLDIVSKRIFGVDFAKLADLEEKLWRGSRDETFPILKSATDSDWLEFLGCLKLNFWDVVEVEKD
jgi:hypothetical protein